MDIRLSVGLTEVIIDDVVVKSVENKDDDFKNHMYEMCGDNDLIIRSIEINS
jgi:hypothetical protein